MADALDDLFRTFTTSAFRLETLQRYEVATEALRAFQEGRPVPQGPGRERWLQRVRGAVAAGRRMGRVHIVDRPLTPYLQYELAAYRENVEAGEKIYIAEREWEPALRSLEMDFWLFDAETSQPAVAWMRYDVEGRIVSRDVTRNLDAVDLCREQRDLALAFAIELHEYKAAQRAS